MHSSCPRTRTGSFASSWRRFGTSSSQQGLPSTVHTDGFPEPTPERVYALVPPHEFVALEGEDALPDEAILRRTIFICAEQPSTVHLEQDIELSRRAGAVFDINSRSVAEFRRAGIPARHLRPGYSPMRDCFDPDVQRDIDVLFLGALTPRRTRWLGGCGRVLAPYNCHLLFSDNSRPNSRTSTTFLTDEKWDLLTRAKIVLNIHQTDEPYFEWLRVLDAIHAGAVVITEHASGVAPLVPGTHLLTASPESLPFVLDAALRDQDLLTQLRLAAHERIRTWLPFAMSASVVRAAAVELVGRPVPPGVRLGRRLTSRSKLPDRWTVVADADADADSGRSAVGSRTPGSTSSTSAASWVGSSTSCARRTGPRPTRPWLTRRRRGICGASLGSV